MTMGFTMLVGRFLMIIPMLAIAGNLARRNMFRLRPERSRSPRPSSPFCWSA